MGFGTAIFCKPSPIGDFKKGKDEQARKKDFLFYISIFMKYPQLVSMPSAVSHWLEEQLEALGIDSEVYTRYILSLLHAHTLDVIYPEDDWTFSGLKKNAGRGALSHKRIRRTGTWWSHAHADAEQIKRSAAVECLMSAAEQENPDVTPGTYPAFGFGEIPDPEYAKLLDNLGLLNCEIESLVDELCEKLKEVSSEGDSSPNKTSQKSKNFKEPLKQRNISSKELAEKYYAAFPPLNHREGDKYIPPNINLVGGKWPTSDKKGIDLIAAKWNSSGSPKKSRRKSKRQMYETTMKPTPKNSQNKNKFGHKRTHCGRSLTKEMADNAANWKCVYNNNNCLKQDQCLDSLDTTMAVAFPEDVHMCNADGNDSPICRMKVWLKNVQLEKDCKTESNNNTVKRMHLYEKKTQYIPLYPTTIWSDNEDLANDEWANNININLEEERRCTPEKDTYSPWSIDGEESAIREEYQRSLKEESESAIKEEYDRPYEVYGRKVALHFDSPSCVNFNEFPVNENMLSPYQMGSDVLNFGLVPPLLRQDNEFTRENSANDVLEEISRRLRGAVICVLCGNDVNDSCWCRDVAKVSPFINFNSLIHDKTLSMMIVNHSVDNSAFCEYRNTEDLCSGPFSHPFGKPIRKSHPLTDMTPPHKLPVIPPPQMSEEQKRTSPNIYFEPIRNLPVSEESKEDGANLQDGTTFNIRGSLDKVKFQRTATGSLILETEFGEFRKYFEYDWRPPSVESVNLPKVRKPPDNQQFNVKYWVSPNDKSCQTVEASSPLSVRQDIVEITAPALKALFWTSEAEKIAKEEPEDVEVQKWATSQSDLGFCFENDNGLVVETSAERHPSLPEEQGTEIAKLPEHERPDSICEADEIVWGYAPKSSDVFCKYCNVKHPWPSNLLRKSDIDWDERTLKDIWGGTETCGTCPWSTKVPTPLVETTSKLREESREEAERLLSDLSSLQLSYSSRLLQAPVKNDEGPSEKKRRHSYMNYGTDHWSFATRLQEDCLISLSSTLPTRRSVTL